MVLITQLGLSEDEVSVYRLPRYSFTVLSEIGFPEDGLPSMDNGFKRKDFLKRDYGVWIMDSRRRIPDKDYLISDSLAWITVNKDYRVWIMDWRGWITQIWNSKVGLPENGVHPDGWLVQNEQWRCANHRCSKGNTPLLSAATTVIVIC